jgi:hypothetical protein
MVERGWSRRYINASIRQITAMFAWGVEEELVPEAVAGALRMVKGLQAGRTKAPERPPIEPVSGDTIDLILPYLSPLAADFVRLMRHC